MAAQRCPRCDAALTGRSAIHLPCVLARARYVLGGILLALAVIIAGVAIVLHTLG